MVSVNVTKESALPAEKTWALIDDFGTIQNFHPLVRESRIGILLVDNVVG